MKTSDTVCLSWAAAVFFHGSPLAAQTDPVGFETLTIHQDQYSLLAVRLHQSSVAAGMIDAAAGAVVTDNEVDFGALDPDQSYAIHLHPPLLPKVVEVLSLGEHTLTLAEEGVVPAGAAYSLRPMWKLSDIFSPVLVPELNPVEDFDPETGDLFLLPDGAGGYREYYWSANAGFEGFHNAATGAAEDPFLDGTEAFLTLRRGETCYAVTSGEMKISGTWIPLVSRFGPVPSVTPLATPDSSGLSASLLAGTAETADVVWSQDVWSGETRRYFYSDGSGPGLTAGWRLVDPAPGGEDADQGGVELSPGLVIRRRGGLPHGVTVAGFSIP